LPFVTTLREWLLTSALAVGELLITAILLVWAAFTVVQIVALLLGFWLTRAADTKVVASMDTARLALIGSTALFTVLSLVLWSVFIYVVGHSIEDMYYQSSVFDAGSGWPSAKAFLDERVRLLGSFFTPLVVLSSLLGLAGLLVLAPALLEELAPTRNLDSAGLRPDAQRWTQSLGGWLGGGLYRLEKWLRILVPLGAIAGGILYLAFVARQFAFAAGVGDALVQTLSGWLEYFQGEALVTAGKWLAGGALTIAALGTRFSNTFGRLRVAIDAIMDVDNYFADPPDGQSPRARIFSRYASLLAYLREAGYARIILVSHSQGTVISAELLHYLHVQGRLQEVAGSAPLALVTVGSPLRDLYAKRFPLLYEWMGQPVTEFADARPAASELGLREWVNACRSGDYVGRFIWSDAGNTASFRIAVEDAANGLVSATRAGDRSEFCLGAGGHTHYFSNDAVALGREIERLVVGG
ncbi:MAG TPA: hypothetical protein VNR18_01825, partial [Hyphomicrobiales bacterium]|nr:hypothetical protein [Hyphomicrobiales bacterium]